MIANIITLEDLEQFKRELISEISELLNNKQNQPIAKKEERVWIKSQEVQQLLGISPGTLQTFRINGTIQYSKIGGTIFYNKEEISNLLEQNMRNRRV